MAFNLYQAILDNINPQAKKQFAEAGQQIKKSAAPVTQFWQGILEQGKRAVQPTISAIKTAWTQAVQNIKQPPKPKMTLFKDEYTMLGKMKADWLDDDKATELIKERRKDLFWDDTKLNSREVWMLQKMVADNLTAKESIALIKQYRSDLPWKQKAEFEKKYAEGNLLQKWAYNALAFGAGNLETIAKYGGNILDLATFWKAWFWEDVKEMERVTQSPEFQGTASKIGRVLPDVALATSTAGVGTPLITWGKTLWSMALRSGAVGAWFWATQPLLEKWTDVTMWDIAKWWAIWGAIGWAVPLVAPLVSKWLKKAWESLYKTAIKPTAQEAERIIGSEARKLANNAQIQKIQSSKLSPATKAKKIEALTWKAPVLRSDTALKYGISGTEKWIGVKWKAESTKLWRDKIAPAIQNSKAEHNIDDMFKKAEDVISKEKSSLRKQELMEGLQALKEDFVSTGKTKFTTADLQAEKSMLDEFTPTKIFKGKEVAGGYTQVKNTMANIFREQVRDDLWKAWVKNAKELYAEWASLSALEDIGVKWITEGGLKWGFGTFWSTVYDKVATPIKTIWGKTIYRVWDKIEFVWPKWIKNLWDYLKKKWYKVSGDKIINLSKNANNLTSRSLTIPLSSSDRVD